MGKKIVAFMLLFLIAATGCTVGNRLNEQEDTGSMWSEKKAQDWYNDQPWPVGCNYLLSTACNQLEMWQEDTFDPETIDREFQCYPGNVSLRCKGRNL